MNWFLAIFTLNNIELTHLNKTLLEWMALNLQPCFTFLSNGDLLGNEYSALENGNNYLEITEWNDVTHELKGNFEINLLIDRAIPLNTPNSSVT